MEVSFTSSGLVIRVRTAKTEIDKKKERKKEKSPPQIILSVFLASGATHTIPGLQT
jgi:hypothetical protein